MTAATTCRTCGTEPLENARFCHSCGSPISPASRPAEYKQVTVLFADVAHSMDIATAVGVVTKAIWRWPKRWSKPADGYSGGIAATTDATCGVAAAVTCSNKSM